MTEKKDFEYQWDEKGKTICISGLSDFDLKQTLECGQCFRWIKEGNGSYTGVAFSRAINIRQVEDSVYIDNCTRQDFLEIWIDYFDLNRDYDKIKRSLESNDPVMKRVISFGQGIRLLKQDEWETLVSFIISQNANIPRIKKSIEIICRVFGKPIQQFKEKTYYAFPTPQDFIDCSKEEIGACRLGYRENYVLKTAEQISRDEGRALYGAKNLGRANAEEYLLSLCGVGPKVANCILLFAMGYYDSFPIDVWMKRVMSGLYGHDENDASAMSAFALDRFGDLSGFAQQYLFYYARENKQTVPKEKKEKEPCLDRQ